MQGWRKVTKKAAANAQCHIQMQARSSLQAVFISGVPAGVLRTSRLIIAVPRTWGADTQSSSSWRADLADRRSASAVK